MRYSEAILAHFNHPKNVGVFAPDEQNVARAAVGSYENGAVVHLQLKILQDKIMGAKFKAYGTAPLIATCSYLTEWVTYKTIAEAGELDSGALMRALEIPELKIHCAIIAQDALKAAISDYSKQNKK
ncbi:MAG: iron-sulfur cluster assembly scaffold protein [Gammaproteobacteria bacterium]|nr:iron-sulfur cluster assembly scaffold protein [Gammaproteobacteria bacterium]